MKVTVNGVDVGGKKFCEIKETHIVKVHNINYRIVDVEITDKMNHTEHHKIAEIDFMAVVDDKITSMDDSISYYSFDDEYMSDIAETIIELPKQSLKVNHMKTYKGVEWCPHCEYENEYNVDENTWKIKCKGCGKTIVLCDKCYTMNGSFRDCGRCKH